MRPTTNLSDDHEGNARFREMLGEPGNGGVLVSAAQLK